MGNLVKTELTLPAKTAMFATHQGNHKGYFFKEKCTEMRIPNGVSYDILCGANSFSLDITSRFLCYDSAAVRVGTGAQGCDESAWIAANLRQRGLTRQHGVYYARAITGLIPNANSPAYVQEQQAYAPFFSDLVFRIELSIWRNGPNSYSRSRVWVYRVSDLPDKEGNFHAKLIQLGPEVEKAISNRAQAMLIGRHIIG